MKILLTGGVKSGKSRYALSLAEKYFTEKNFLATSIAFDEEMETRIKNHQEERKGLFNTIEEPLYIDRKITNNCILDCITIWMNNIFYYEMENRWESILDDFLANLPENVIIITNEVGLGNIPADEYSRRYNRALAMANGLIAEKMDRVYFMVSGLPMRVK